MKIKYVIALFLATFCQVAHADPISADRPGVGSSPDIVQPGSIQFEAGNDSQNARIGITKNLEVSKDDQSVGMKYQFYKDGKFRAATKVSYANDSTFIIELPTQYDINDKVSLGTDVILTKDSQTYVGSVNYNLTKNFTVSNDVYYDDHVRYAVFVGYILPSNPNIQLDVGYDQEKVKFGISWRFRFH